MNVMKKQGLVVLVALCSTLLLGSSTHIVVGNPLESHTESENICSNEDILSKVDTGFLSLNRNFYKSQHGFDLCDVPGWTVKLEGQLGIDGTVPGGSVSVSCESGGEESCSLLVWCNVEEDNPEDRDGIN